MDFQHEIDKLDAMTADEIADVFRENNIKGIRRSPTNCAIANYLYEVLDLTVTVGSGDKIVTIVGEKITIVDEMEMVDLFHGQAFQGGLYDFVRKFDSGYYPDLDDCQHQVLEFGRCLKCGAGPQMPTLNKAVFSGLHNNYTAMINHMADLVSVS